MVEQLTPFQGTEPPGEFRVYSRGQHPSPKRSFHPGTFPTRQKARNWCRNHVASLGPLVIVHPDGFEGLYMPADPKRVWVRTTVKFNGGPLNGEQRLVPRAPDTLPAHYVPFEGGYYSRDLSGFPPTYSWVELRPGRYPPVGALTL